MELCKPSYNQKRVNSNNNLQLTGECVDGCEGASSIQYVYKVYPNTGTETNKIFNTNIYSLSNAWFKGNPNSNELSIISETFNNMSSVKHWKVTLSVIVDMNKVGESSLIFNVNSKPFGGTCSVNSNNGYALTSYFTIKCLNWQDSDGEIMRYEYQGT